MLSIPSPIAMVVEEVKRERISSVLKGLIKSVLIALTVAVFTLASYGINIELATKNFIFILVISFISGLAVDVLEWYLKAKKEMNKNSKY
jgi:hypothetical protein